MSGGRWGEGGESREGGGEKGRREQGGGKGGGGGRGEREKRAGRGEGGRGGGEKEQGGGRRGEEERVERGGSGRLGHEQWSCCTKLVRATHTDLLALQGILEARAGLSPEILNGCCGSTRQPVQTDSETNSWYQIVIGLYTKPV